MKSRARRCTLVTLASCLVSVLGLALLNYLVDPFDRFGNNRLGVYVMAEREVKADWVKSYPHEALYIGNSRMQVIQASDVKRIRLFNAAFAAANPEQIYWFLHHFAHGQKLVVLGMDLGMNDPQTPEGDIFGSREWRVHFDHVVNFQTVEYSFKAIVSHLAKKPSHYLPDGSTYQADWGNGTRRDDPVIGKVRIEDYKNAVAGMVTQFPHRLTFLRKIADTLRERNIRCVLVVPPIHEDAARAIEARHLQPQAKAWVDAVRMIFPDLLDLSMTPYGAADGYFARDPVHYKAVVGARFMNEVVVPFALQVLNRGAE